MYLTFLVLYHFIKGMHQRLCKHGVSYVLCCILNKSNAEDAEVEYILKYFLYMNDEAASQMFMEDVLPQITKIYKTQRWTKYCRKVGEFHEYLKKHVKEHESSFDPSKDDFFSNQ